MSLNIILRHSPRIEFPDSVLQFKCPVQAGTDKLLMMMMKDFGFIFDHSRL